MKLKDVLEFSRKTQDKAESGKFEIEYGDWKEFIEVGMYFNERAVTAKNFVTERMKEEDFVRLIQLSQSALLTSLMAEGKGLGLAMGLHTGELDGFVQTVTLNIIGTLIDEEVL